MRWWNSYSYRNKKEERKRSEKKNNMKGWKREEKKMARKGWEEECGRKKFVKNRRTKVEKKRW
jgi:hypothetical protein